MILLKTSAETLDNVLKHQKHASKSKIQYELGEIILIQQTVNTLSSPEEKTIRWVMNCKNIYPDLNNESDSIWGQHWNYIIQGENLRAVDGFNITDLQVSTHNYKPIVTHGKVKPEDEEAIINWIGDNNVNLNPIIEAEELETLSNIDFQDIYELIEALNRRYAGKPTYNKNISYSINRPTALKNAIIKRDGTRCKICGYKGFLKKTGENYCELHHMIELNKLAPNTLQSWNILVVCPNCHRQLHYGNVMTEFLNPGWKIIIDGVEHIIL